MESHPPPPHGFFSLLFLQPHALKDTTTPLAVDVDSWGGRRKRYIQRILTKCKLCSKRLKGINQEGIYSLSMEKPSVQISCQFPYCHVKEQGYIVTLWNRDEQLPHGTLTGMNPCLVAQGLTIT